MERPRLLILGAGGHGRAVLELLRDAGFPPPLGVLDDGPASPGLPGVPHLGPLSRMAALRAEGAAAAHVALGHNATRRRLGEALLALGYALPALRHPSAIVAGSATLGAGSVAMPRSVAGAAARLGAHSILNTGAILEHDAVTGPGCHIAPGAVLGGGVRLGAEVLVGILAGIKPGTAVGDGATIALGAAVVGDVPAGATVSGVPAREKA
ncbi:NeuD/PglB/VioB family sugar acetyltransferase [Teichococcus aestuarii]|uniref:Carbonic anhydrase n=1 Tax=Teichococcus aestuarii TaxID=568898 RepID=A0A2U1V8A5_9PROT|nr:NeuD/PglB/VioB family sugar acetyltransferase [Pseudoroseomonas aestuarii]PWC30147.1 carbonic anhydrase [Pseudoroseomonas aestuarii]